MTATQFAADERPKPARPSTRRMLACLAVALAVVVAAWALAGRQGVGNLGQGGVNQRLLPRVGEVAPDITITNVLGQRVSLSSFRGQPVWLNFWGSWCAPCRSEMPDIQTAYVDLEPRGVVLLAVSLDEPWLDATTFAARNQISFPIFIDQFRTDTGDAYPIYNFPTHIFIDKDGIVRHVVLTQMSVDDAIYYATETINQR